MNKNEDWIQSKDLNNVEWWSALSFDYKFDLVLHFAEPVKEKLDNGHIDKIVGSHVSFLRNLSNGKTILIYPLTAYFYDDLSYGSNYSYLTIKNKTFRSLSGYDNMLFPIFHPLIDYGAGLNKVVELFNKIPYVNVFCSFNSSMPILRKKSLCDFFLNVYYFKKCGATVDIYSEVIRIKSIFSKKNRLNIVLISNFFKKILKIFAFIPQVKLLLNGRRIR